MGRTLEPDVAEPLLKGRFGHPYVFHDTVESTQEHARDLPHGGVVVCELQTAGRGRLGRVWECPHGAGVMFSLALHPRTPVDRLPALSLVIADAVCDAVPVDARVRWPNDVVVRDRKLTGILIEQREGRVTAGVGVNANLTQDQLPPAARVTPTSLLLETGSEADRPQLLADILWAIEQRYARFEEQGFTGLNHDGLAGRWVTLAGGGEGVCDGVDQLGRLIVGGVSHSSAEVTSVIVD